MHERNVAFPEAICFYFFAGVSCYRRGNFVSTLPRWGARLEVADTGGIYNHRWSCGETTLEKIVSMWNGVESSAALRENGALQRSLLRRKEKVQFASTYPSLLRIGWVPGQVSGHIRTCFQFQIASPALQAGRQRRWRTRVQ